MSTKANTNSLSKQTSAEIAVPDNACKTVAACCANTGGDSITAGDSVVAHESSVAIALSLRLALIEKGDVVIVADSEGDDQAFLAAHEAGEKGTVIVIDAVERERKNEIANIIFRQGDIKNMPVNDSVADVLVGNMMPGKEGVFKEIFRVLKPNGRFCISDIVLPREIPEDIAKAAELYAGSASTAIQKEAYLQMIEDNGFMNVKMESENEITGVDEILRSESTHEEINLYERSGAGLYRVIISGEKSCCGPNALTCQVDC